jgi:ubiquinone/menaquinone biosynthesis C-methylase UbiE
MMKDPYDWVTGNFTLRKKRDLEEMQTDTNKATSANAYSWIRKGNITMEFAGDAERILDVGCGWGRELSRLRNAVGIDICLPFLKTARHYVKNDVVLADARYLPFKENSFDFAVISEVIEHIVNPIEALNEIKRVLKSKAEFLIQTPNKLLTLGKFISREECGHIHEFSFSELKNLLVSLGFRVLQRTGSTIPYIPSMSKLERLNYSRLFFSIWKSLDKIVPLKWDVIVLSEINRGN